MLDGILHHSIMVNFNGESYGLKDERKAGLVGAHGQAPKRCQRCLEREQARLLGLPDPYPSKRKR
jgi:hypothetical protein